MVKKYIALATFVLFGVLMAGPAEGQLVQLGFPAGQKLVKDKELTKVSRDLLALQQAYATHLQSRSLEPFKASNPYLRVVDGLVVIDAVAAGEAEELLTAMKALGLQRGAAFGRMVSGRLPIEAIEKLKSLASLKFIRPAYMSTNIGLVTSQGDAAMRADLVRSALPVDGTGVTVGTLSDSFNCLGGWVTDVASGDLPAGINVLQEYSGCPDGTDEGRGMMQLIHDVAPGASQAFHTASDGMADFAQGILDLASAGADVITDDVSYLAEPMFQDGIIAQAVDQVVGMGKPYFSSAGNSGRQSYESQFRPSGKGVAYPGGNAHNFNPGSGTDVFQRIKVPEGVGFYIVLQWDDPFYSVSGSPGAATDMDLFITNRAGTGAYAWSAEPNIGGDPVEVLVFYNPPGSGETIFNVLIEKYDGPDPGRIKYVRLYGGDAVTVEYDTASSTIYGHSNAAGARAVGAAFYDETPAFGQSPPLLEYFSSGGPTPIYFDVDGSALPSPEIRQKPEIVAPDGANTTFFGSDIPEDADAYPNFFGTSAAAPHAAAVAALMLDYDPSLTVNGIYSALENTAIDMLTPGFDYDSGFGLIQADKAIGLHGLTVAVNPSSAGTVTGDSMIIDCPGNCSGVYESDTVVVLTVTPNPGFNFDAWSGCDSVNGLQCTVTMNADKAVTASFFNDIEHGPHQVLIQSKISVKKVKGGKDKAEDPGSTITFNQTSGNGGDFVIDTNGRSLTGTFTFEVKKEKIKKIALAFDPAGLGELQDMLLDWANNLPLKPGTTLTVNTCTIDEIIIKAWKFSSDIKMPKGKMKGKATGTIDGDYNGEAQEKLLKFNFKIVLI